MGCGVLPDGSYECAGTNCECVAPSRKTEGRLVFACGATIYGKDLSGHPPGAKLVVFTSPQQGHSRPVPSKETMEAMGLKGDPEKFRMNCLIMCPCTKREAGNKHQVVRFQNKDGSDGARGHVITCRVKSWDTSEAGKAKGPSEGPTPNKALSHPCKDG
jgi:hypothetical protein